MGGWDIAGRCVGARQRELLSEPLCKQPVPTFPGASCSLGYFWGVSGVCWGRSISGCLFRAAPGPGAALYPCPSQRCPGSPVPIPGMCVWHAVCHRQDTAGTAPLCKSKAQELLLPFLGLPAFSLPPFPASWDTQKEHQGTLLAMSRSH